MGQPYKPSKIEKFLEAIGLISNRSSGTSKQQQGKADIQPARGKQEGELASYPEPSTWNHWVEYGADGEPKSYSIVPTTCFNCEAGCGLLAFIDRESGTIRKIEGNPEHPGSRGRNCAKGPATINQVKDPGRILYPLKRDGPRGSGRWKRVDWEEALHEIADRMKTAIEEDRGNEITYHVGRPGHEGYMERVLNAWGIDGHNSHTNICSSGARTGYGFWHKYDRPSADFANAELILLLSAHLESGHYFNPHAQRIIESMSEGGNMAVMDPRLSNTAAMADYWMPTQPGSEAAVLLAMARIILNEEQFDESFLKNWVNWEQYLDERHSDRRRTFDTFLSVIQSEYDRFTPDFAESESGVKAEVIVDVARKIGEAGSRFASHIWRSAASGNYGGWQVSRCLHFLSVLVGAVGTRGGTSPNAWHKFSPDMPHEPPQHKLWDEIQFPPEWPFAHYEMSPFLPYLLEEGRGKIDVYFTRVFNPVYTYPDGFSWIEMLSDPEKIGMHVALTPTWNETAYYADYVLPMGHSPERHDIQSQETHAGTWVSFRQPVLREFAEREGEDPQFTYEANPGEVWEEDEFWIELSWKMDPDGTLGIRDYFRSPYREKKDSEEDPPKMTIDEYYQWIFEHTDGLAEKAKEKDMEPLEYMKQYGVFEVSKNQYRIHEQVLDKQILEREDVEVDEYGTIRRVSPESDGFEEVLGVMVDGEPRKGFPTPTGKQQFFSKTLVEWGWDEKKYCIPHYLKSHIHPDRIDYEAGERVLVPTFRLPTHIHSRSSNSKWLEEISHKNPVWIHTRDANQLGLETGDLVRVETDLGYFVNGVWVTESIKPGIVAMSHHMGQWKIQRDGENQINEGGTPFGRVTVRVKNEDSTWGLRQVKGIHPTKSEDPDTERIWWSQGGVAQNLTHAPHPDPISGMHCWHQKVRVLPAKEEDRYGDIYVDTDKSFEIYRKWKEQTRSAPGPGGLRRPPWMKRPVPPEPEAWFMDGPVGRKERWNGKDK